MPEDHFKGEQNREDKHMQPPYNPVPPENDNDELAANREGLTE
jgi:hypothetical protein